MDAVRDWKTTTYLRAVRVHVHHAVLEEASQVMNVAERMEL